VLEPHELLLLARAALAHHLAMADDAQLRGDIRARWHHRAQALFQAKGISAYRAAAQQEAAP